MINIPRRHFVDEARRDVPVPMLWDAALVCATDDVWVLSGLERVASDSGDNDIGLVLRQARQDECCVEACGDDSPVDGYRSTTTKHARVDTCESDKNSRWVVERAKKGEPPDLAAGIELHQLLLKLLIGKPKRYLRVVHWSNVVTCEGRVTK